MIAGRWQDVLPGAYDPATAIVVTDPPFGLESVIRHRGERVRAHLGKGYGDPGAALSVSRWAAQIEEGL